jgi:hypothetical protein
MRKNVVNGHVLLWSVLKGTVAADSIGLKVVWIDFHEYKNRGW